MDGVTILAEIPRYILEPSVPAFVISYVVGIVIGFVIGFIYGVASKTKKLKNGFIGAMTGILLGFLIGVPASFSLGTENFAYTEYKVTIDDSVSMNEFYEKYEIISQEGLIFTVKEKNTK